MVARGKQLKFLIAFARRAFRTPSRSQANRLHAMYTHDSYTLPKIKILGSPWRCCDPDPSNPLWSFPMSPVWPIGLQEERKRKFILCFPGLERARISQRGFCVVRGKEGGRLALNCVFVVLIFFQRRCWEAPNQYLRGFFWPDLVVVGAFKVVCLSSEEVY